MVERRADELLELVCVARFGAKLRQGMIHAAADALLGVEQGAVEIEHNIAWHVTFPWKHGCAELHKRSRTQLESNIIPLVRPEVAEQQVPSPSFCLPASKNASTKYLFPASKMGERGLMCSTLARRPIRRAIRCYNTQPRIGIS